MDERPTRYREVVLTSSSRDLSDEQAFLVKLKHSPNNRKLAAQKRITYTAK